MNQPANKLRAIVTGASSGIGKATALAFAKSGIEVVLLSRSKDKLKAVADEIEALENPVKTYIHTLDLEILPQVKSEINQICDRFGPIDILVNNAGMAYTNSLRDTSLEDWQKIINLNLTSAFLCIQGVLPQMRDRNSGTIINVASSAAFNVYPDWGAYSVSKAALVALSKSISAEEREHGIRTVIIAPGSVNTPIWDTDTVKVDYNRASMLTPEIVAQSILHAALLPHQAVVEEMIVMPSGGAL